MYFLYPLILFLIPVHAAFANNYLEVPKRDYVKALIFMEITIGLLLLGCLFLINNQSLAALIFSLNFAYLLNANILYIALFSEYKRSKIRYFVLFYDILTRQTLILTHLQRFFLFSGSF